MRKIYLLGVLLLSAACSLMAISRPVINSGFITLRPISGVIISTPPIGTRPWSVDDELFTAFLDVNELLITSENVTSSVVVEVECKDGVVYSTSATMAPGAEISISTEDWAEGVYTLYIYYGTEVLVGEFEIINE